MNPREKAQEIAANAPRAGAVLAFGRDSVRFIEDVKVNEHGAAVLNLAITREGAPLDISMPLIVVNPPVVVDDPSGDIVIKGEDGEDLRGSVNGRAALDEILRVFLERH